MRLNGWQWAWVIVAVIWYGFCGLLLYELRRYVGFDWGLTLLCLAPPLVLYAFGYYIAWAIRNARNV